MENNRIIPLRDHPDYLETAADWFSQKWGIPARVYRKSIQACIAKRYSVPQWYLFLDGKQAVAAGAGVIENDFHDRPDLSPNLCALFVEERCRNQGIARSILDFARKDFGRMGFQKLYLVTDHTSFYERCGWEFLTLATDAGGASERVYAAPTL
ncbi:GNAT family N-acetyltransferase [Anaerotruncus rubiinfantis]|uniref:GNAT family N-acetyltransferase n=1 Tax=Anaerotruncus rubiinfantis TaxID=1720200 RepID=UPI0034A54207